MAHTSENTTGFKTFQATASAIGVGVRVKVDTDSKISAAGATDAWIGTTVSAIASGDYGTVRLRNQPGTHMFVAAGAIEKGDRLYAAASGKVNDVASAGDPTGFVAITAAAADGDLFEAAPATGPAPVGVITIPIVLAQVTAADVLTTWTPGFAGTITKVDFAVSVPVTTAAKAATLNLEIGTTNLTGGTVALTSANCTPLGAVVAGAAITANNSFGSTDTVSVEAASVTAFVEGEGYLLITYVMN